ncbi:MAG TPA: hypothetical protein VFV31_10575 [Chitinophagaceae bacterium]|nr:hypothetical protein [Chitinophagaceae bacterium]
MERLTKERLKGIDVSNHTLKQLCVKLECKKSTLIMFLKRQGLEYKKYDFKFLTEDQKQKITELASEHKRIYTLAHEVGVTPYSTRNYLLAKGLPYRGRVEKKENNEFFSWEMFPEGIL